MELRSPNSLNSYNGPNDKNLTELCSLQSDKALNHFLVIRNKKKKKKRILRWSFLIASTFALRKETSNSSTLKIFIMHEIQRAMSHKSIIIIKLKDIYTMSNCMLLFFVSQCVHLSTNEEASTQLV